MVKKFLDISNVLDSNKFLTKHFLKNDVKIQVVYNGFKCFDDIFFKFPTREKLEFVTSAQSPPSKSLSLTHSHQSIRPSPVGHQLFDYLN